MIKVLVVDDESIIRISCERTLASGGYKVKSASSGKEGIEILDKESFNLVLLDLKMPDMDGFEVLKLIRNRWPDIKVIIITGYGIEQTAKQTLEHGAHNFLGKPFTPDKLLAVISETLQQ